MQLTQTDPWVRPPGGMRFLQGFQAGRDPIRPHGARNRESSPILSPKRLRLDGVGENCHHSLGMPSAGWLLNLHLVSVCHDVVPLTKYTLVETLTKGR